MVERLTTPGIAIFALLLAACVVGEIEGPAGRTTRRRDAGSPTGDTEQPGGDLPDPPSDDTRAPPPPSDPVDSGSTAHDSSTPPPPPETGPAPPPPETPDDPSSPYGLAEGSVTPKWALSGLRGRDRIPGMTSIPQLETVLTKNGG